MAILYFLTQKKSAMAIYSVGSPLTEVLQNMTLLSKCRVTSALCWSVDSIAMEQCAHLQRSQITKLQLLQSYSQKYCKSSYELDQLATIIAIKCLACLN